jgi:hypothetical protein
MTRKKPESKALAPTVAVTTRPAVPEKKKIERVETRDDKYFSIYVNDLRIQTGVWDVRLKLGEIDGDSPDVLKIRTFGEIHMSPQLGKRFVILLAAQLKAYEEKFGSIPENKD